MSRRSFPEPVFTPSTKAEQGTHDENITFAKVREMIGGELASRVRDASIEVYTAAAGIAEERGVIIADTKFEFGIDRDTGELILIDEALTPDSSRFWPREDYAPGGPQTSFDKQFVRTTSSTRAGTESSGPGASTRHSQKDKRKVPRDAQAFLRRIGFWEKRILPATAYA